MIDDEMAATTAAPKPSTPQVITDIQIPFWRMVAVLFKLGLASIVAGFLLFLATLPLWLALSSRNQP